jgi:undecaprenyl-diphosphatase
MRARGTSLSHLRPDPLVVTACGGAAAFSWLAARTYERGALEWDRDILLFVAPWTRDERVSNVVDIMTVTVLWVGLAAATYLLAWLVIRGRRRDALFWALTIAGVYVLDTGFKAALRRPSISGTGDGFSFPSGNAMASAAALAAMCILVSPAWRVRVLVVGMPAVALYGAALVFLAWHYPSDVLAGWFLAFAWVAFVALSLGPAAARLGSLGPSLQRRLLGSDSERRRESSLRSFARARATAMPTSRDPSIPIRPDADHGADA